MGLQWGVSMINCDHRVSVRETRKPLKIPCSSEAEMESMIPGVPSQATRTGGF